MIAQGLCVRHCAVSDHATSTGTSCCAGKSHASSDIPADRGSTSCGGLKAVQFDSKTGMDGGLVATVAPAVVLFVLPDLEESPDSVGSEFLRTRPRADFVFVPEHSLGAALRSTAPPTLG